MLYDIIRDFVQDFSKIKDICLSDPPENTEKLRQFHNWIKLQLILYSKQYTNGGKLLDVACGRGGDILKWTKAKFNFVTAIDNDTDSIYETEKFDGALKRYTSLKKNSTNIPNVFFWNASVTDPDILKKLNSIDFNTIYDVVSCQFSFHYFVKEIDVVLNMISNKLKKNGLFIGTASDGDLINNILNVSNVNLPLLYISKDSDISYKYEIKTGKTKRETYFEYRGALSEYFLYKNFLIDKCKQYNLQLLSMKNFHEWIKDYRYATISDHEAIISFLNFSFIFRKN